MKVRIILLIGLVFDALIVIDRAINLSLLWAILIFAAGVLVGAFVIRGDRRVAYSICAAAIILVAFNVVVRLSPIHSFDWSPIRHLDQITIEFPLTNERIEIQDQETLAEFMEFGKRGSYATVVGKGTHFGIELRDGRNIRRLMIDRRYLYDGWLPADEVQTVFMPRNQEALRKWLDCALERARVRIKPTQNAGVGRAVDAHSP
jgi:hypothetical protein